MFLIIFQKYFAERGYLFLESVWPLNTCFGSSTILAHPYRVKNEDNKLPKLTLIDIHQAANEFVVELKRLKIYGLEREIESDGWFMPNALFESLPMLSRIYAMLKEDLENEYGARFS